MFIRSKRSVQNGQTYEYLQLVRSYRDRGHVRQQVVANLGRRELLVTSGQLDGLLRSLGRFSHTLRVVEAVRSQGLQAHTARAWGPALVFGRLWERQGLPEILHDLAQRRQFRFAVERVTFTMALQRLCCPGSALQGAAWVQTVEAPGVERLALQHFYRTVAFLAEVRQELEQALFLRDRDLFTQTLEVVFIDTTSLYVYRDTETAWRKRGYSRDRRGDLPQFVLCVVVDAHGWPIAWEIFPGQTADAKALAAVVQGLRERFAIRQVIVVADRGMMAQDTIQLLTDHATAPFDYVLGCRMRRQQEVSEDVLARAGRYERVDDHLEVKEVRVGPRRYVVCLNPIEAAKDAATREALRAQLEDTLAHQGPKAVIANRGFARFLKVTKGSVSIDREALRRDARLDGKFVLRTNTDLPPAEVARTYKSLWRVERTFREEKSTLAVRPISHHRDDTSIGHIVASFLALRLEVHLQRLLDERHLDVSWPALMRDLGQVHAVLVELDGQRYRLRTDLVGSAHHAFAAAGVRVPSPVTALGQAPPPSNAPGLQETVVPKR
jgi:hypothetical protein